jgi:hypothetical protein
MSNSVGAATTGQIKVPVVFVIGQLQPVHDLAAVNVRTAIGHPKEIRLCPISESIPNTAIGSLERHLEAGDRSFKEILAPFL